MTAKEKEIVVRRWDLFIRKLLEGYDKSYVDRYGNRMPLPFKYFSDRLYKHLINSCSFIAHYDRFGFYSTYFLNGDDVVRFFRQFDRDFGYKSVEYSWTYWLNGDYSDVNGAMCEVFEKYKGKVYETFLEEQKREDINEAKSLLKKHGISIEI